MRITRKIDQYHNLIDELSGLAETISARWDNYPNLVNEAYGDHGEEFPMMAYIQDVEDEAVAVLDEVRRRIRAIKKKYCPNVIEEGFEHLEEEEEVDEDPPF